MINKNTIKFSLQFMEDAVVDLYRFGHTEKAMEYAEILTRIHEGYSEFN